MSKNYEVLNELVPKTKELHRAIFDKGYEQGKKEIRDKTGEWIPVSERLPGMKETVLVTDDGDLYFEEHGEGWCGQATTIAYMTEEGWEISDIDYDCQMNKITAWMPLPEPYMEG